MPKRGGVFIFVAAVAVLFATGCSCSSDVKLGPGDGGLGQECRDDKDCSGDLVCSDKGLCAVSCGLNGCPDGFYCGADNTCTQDCGEGIGECTGGAVCAVNGQCIVPNDGGDLDVDCPDVIVDVEAIVPTVVLLLDRSSSMSQAFGNTTRWDAVRQALTNNVNGVVTELESKVIFGANLYDHSNGCPNIITEAPALNNANNLRTLLNSYSPGSGTPTAEAVVVTLASFPAADGPRVLVLATDGDPYGCNDSDVTGNRTATENAVKAVYDAGIKTFVLSVGTETSGPHLEKVARLGQGQDPATGTAEAYIASDPDMLSAAFEDIIRGVRTCDFTLDGTVADNDANKGTVTLNGTPLTYGSDWSLENGSTIHLLGAACDTFLGSDSASLSASFPCGIVLQ